MAHASGVQWRTYSNKGRYTVPDYTFIGHQLHRNRESGSSEFRRFGGFRIILVFSIILFSLTFGTFIHTSFGLEEDSQAGTDVQPIYSQSTAHADGAVDYKQHVVVAGDTLWALAQDHAPKGMDLRQYVLEIKAFNGMNQSVIYEGQVIRLP